MISKLNNKGFTLVELLAVLVILIAIMGIAIPTISSSLERTKEKQNQSRYKILESSAELYVTDYKNKIYSRLGNNSTCVIKVSQLSEYLTEEEMVDSDDNYLGGNYVIYTKPNIYQYSSSNEGNYPPCIELE